MSQEFDVKIHGRAFFLRPDIPKEGITPNPRPGEEDGLLAEPLRSYASESGLIMRRPKLTPYTVTALEASEYAQQKGKFLDFHHSMYKALWEEGKDLGNPSVLREVAEESDLEWSDLEEKLATGHYRETIREQHQQAIDIGVRGIPAFVIGDTVFTGAQPYEVFKMAVTRVLE